MAVDNAQHTPTGPPEPHRGPEYARPGVRQTRVNEPWHPDERPPRPVYDAPAWRLNTGQLTVGTAAAVEIAGNNPDRLSLIITNGDTANAIFVADSAGVSSATGHKISAGVSLNLSHYRGPVFVIASQGSIVVTYCEETI